MKIAMKMKASSPAVAMQESDPLLVGSTTNQQAKNDDDVGASSSAAVQGASAANRTATSTRREGGSFLSRNRAPAVVLLLLTGIAAAAVATFFAITGTPNYLSSYYSSSSSNNDAKQMKIVKGVVRGKHSSSKKSSSSSSVKEERKYEATQFISFTINTMGGVADKGECEGRKVDPDYEGSGMCYLGNSRNLTEDLEHRFYIVKDALTTIRNDRKSDNPEIDHSSKVLKIVMLPEFFFRGPYGAYNITSMLIGTPDNNDYPILLQLADAIEAITDDDDFEHYLFVFGTAILARSSLGKYMLMLLLLLLLLLLSFSRYFCVAAMVPSTSFF